MSDLRADTADPPAAEPRRRRGRRWWRRTVAVGVLVWLVVCAAMLALAALNARQGLEQMKDLRDVATGDLPTFVDSIGGSQDDVAEEDAAGQLRSAADSFETAYGLVRSPVIRPFYVVPMVGRQLRSVDALSGAAATTASEASTAFDELEQILASGTETPEARLEAAERTEEVLVELNSAISDLDLGPSVGLVTPLAKARNQFSEEYASVTNTLGVATAAVAGLNDLLAGPSRYLVLAANNSEMRAGSGMFLQVGVMDVDAGRFEVGDFTPAGELYLEEPGAELDPDVAATWAWLRPNQEWRNLNLTPRFDESARMAADMWESSGRGPVDGVIAVDVIGLQLLLELVGPVDVGELPGADVVSAETVARDLLLDQYVDFVDDRDARRDRLGAVASASFEAFNSRPVAASKLLKVLQSAGEGRHVMLWSSIPVQQDAWVALDASGVLPDNSVLLSVLNRGGNKLDQFLDVDAELSVVGGDSEGLQRIRVVTSLRNVAPKSLPRYVEGPHPRSQVAAGDYLGILALTVPSGAGNVAVTGAPQGSAFDDGTTRVATAPVLVPLNGAVEVVVEFDLTQDWNILEVLPSARIPAVQWTAGAMRWRDTAPREVSLDELG